MKYLLTWITKRIYTLLDKVTFSWLSFAITYIYLSIVQRIKKKRFDEYNYFVDGQPEKTGFFVPPVEWELDCPRKTPAVDKADDVFFFGVNSKNDGLAVHIARQLNNKVSCSLLLRFSDGREFVLPNEHIIQTETAEEHTFGSSRFKIQCLRPMRKWRIFFNGLLKDNSSHSEVSHPKYKHVSFAFIYTASSDAFDFENAMHKNLLAHHMSTSVQKFSAFPLCTLKRMQKVFSSYEQSGMILGTVKIENEDEQEMYFWGNRGRYTGEVRNLENGDFVQIYGSFENGAVVHIGILNVDNFLFKFSHGFVMRSDGFIHPIENLVRSDEKLFKEQYSYQFFCGNVQYKLVIAEADEEYDFQKEFVGKSSVKFSDFILNGWQGRGFIFRGTTHGVRNFALPTFRNLDQNPNAKPLVVSFEETSCQDSSLTGGKGSSLGKLYRLSVEFNEAAHVSTLPSFQVSKGFVITTEAYKLFIEQTLDAILEKFQKEVWAKPEGKTRILCEKMVKEVAKTKIPNKIVVYLTETLRKVFSSDHKKIKFAVRSSATGEDTEQMSAAGQMDTFLGIKGTEELIEAVRKCWASQFTFEAVEYKRRNGQLLNTPMAVVVQEMVPCEVAGVAFTSDPLTGNPEFISITANFGLGESVVSASAEPDTIILKRDIENNLKIYSQEIGKKGSKVIMADDNGVQYISTDTEVSECCLSDELALKLGHIAVKLEEKFGSPRDLEWGVVGEDVYFFQARPITSIDIDTDFESKHDFDTYMRIENEYYSKANVGEVMCGALSPLGLDFLNKIFDMCYGRQRWVYWDGSELPKPPYFEKRLHYAYRHVFICFLDGFMRLEDPKDEYTTGVMFAVWGRDINDDEMNSIAKERHNAYGKRKQNQLIYNVYSTWIKYVSGFFNRRLSTVVNKYEFPVSHMNSPSQILRTIANNYQICVKAIYSHLVCTLSSSMWNMNLLFLLFEAKKEWSPEVYSDFSFLLSTCSQIESADVPAAVQKLGFIISMCIDVETFKKMEPDAALKWLEATDTEAGTAFKQFLLKHGHRCVKEFDVASSTWEMDPRPLVKMLQNFISTNTTQSSKKEIPSFSSILSNLHMPLGILQRGKMYWFLQNARRCVREREYAKSVIIKSIHKARKALNHLADVMVKEGYLPNKTLLFFLALEEIKELIETRSPRLVARAIKRSKCHDELNNLIFPEITKGVPIPVNRNKTCDYPSGGFTMKGIPVSKGVVKATARVVMNIEEAVNIKQGDVLITYSTDIGWSPYFPLLSGVVTELGGLISHGAVVARECGLPCVVGLHGATQAFRSGDTVVLDGNKGTLQKVEDNLE